MKLRYKLYAALLAGLMLLLSGCGQGAEAPSEPATEATLRETVTEADPEAAVEEIYGTLPELGEAVTRNLSGAVLTNSFPGLDPALLVSYAGRLSSADGGLADVVFLEPAEGKRDAARGALQQYKEARIREFENYDILGAFEIAQNAIVIDQGDYVILLMLAEDIVEPAREIIDKYIPL